MKLRFATLVLCVLICVTTLGAAADNTITVGGSAAGAVAGSATISLGSSGNDTVVDNSTDNVTNQAVDNSTDNVTNQAVDNSTDNTTNQTVDNSTDSVTPVDNSSTTVICEDSNNTTKTYADLAAFLENDTTEKALLENINIPHPEYAENLYINATAAGFNCSVETASFQCGCPADRSVVVFNTSDQGQIIIDDTGTVDGSAVDKNVTQLKVGKEFESTLFGDENNTQPYNRGVVSAITPMDVENLTNTTV